MVQCPTLGRYVHKHDPPCIFYQIGKDPGHSNTVTQYNTFARQASLIKLAGALAGTQSKAWLVLQRA